MHSKPNILLLHADQLRADCIGAYGNAQISTPSLDALSQDADIHENHFCTFPVCTPSRYSLLTGQYPHQHRGLINHSTPSDEIPTFVQALRGAGYQTAAVGKMHFTPTYLDAGFDRLTLAEQDGNGRFEDDYHRYLRANGLLDCIDVMDQRHEYRQHAPKAYFENYGAQVSDLPEAHHSTTWITDRALDEIASWDSDGAHMLMVGYIKPHHPFDPPAPYDTLYDPDTLDLLPGYTETIPEADLLPGYFDYAKMDEAALKRIMAHYYGAITHIDHHIGRIIALLKEKGLYDNTLILFTSDHGEYMGFHHLLLKNNHLYDPLMRIPLMVKYPGNPKSRRIAALSDNTQIATEMLRLCGLTPPPCTSPFGLDDERDYVFSETYIRHEGYPKYGFMVRSATHKLLVFPESANRLAIHKMMLCDLSADPLELNDLSGSPAHAPQIAAHMWALISWLSGTLPVHFVNEQAPTAPQADIPSPAEQAATKEYMWSHFEGYAQRYK